MLQPNVRRNACYNDKSERDADKAALFNRVGSAEEIKATPRFACLLDLDSSRIYCEQKSSSSYENEKGRKPVNFKTAKNKTLAGKAIVNSDNGGQNSVSDL